jgi:hypothetical protein
MASEAKIAANRRNAARSTGPKTGPGKAIASLNALKTGTYAKTSSLMPGEDRGGYGEIEQQVYAQWRPVGAIEEECVRSIIENLWRRERLRRLEAEAMERYMMQYCYDEHQNLNDNESYIFIDKLFEYGHKLEKKKNEKYLVHKSLSQYAKKEMRYGFTPANAAITMEEQISIWKVEEIFRNFDDKNLLFQAYKASMGAMDATTFARHRQDTMRDLLKNFAFLATLQNRRQTVPGNVNAVVVSNDTEASC